MDANFTCETCAAGYIKKGSDCVEVSCFSPASIAATGLTNFGQIAVWDGRVQKELVLIFNKPINFITSDFDGKLKISSTKLDGSDEVAITGLTVTKITSRHLLHLSYGTEVPADRSIKLGSLSGFKLISEDATIISELSVSFCPKTTSDIAVSGASHIGSSIYNVKMMKISTTSSTFSPSGDIDTLHFAVLGLDKIGSQSNLIYKAKTTFSEKLATVSVDLSNMAKEGVKGDYEVMIFYHAGLGIGGDKPEDKKYLSENFVPGMIKVSLSSLMHRKYLFFLVTTFIFMMSY